ncbi:MAG: Thymidylate kinase [uncultured marine phage]|uniref:Thymidylate kinase n=1 Tax=uncultured marine phage TaxID=707152 RepID=A0A8D9CF65_9VIRU|nr:MAG: Thymidylate kinase [uncultured marine phage]
MSYFQNKLNKFNGTVSSFLKGIRIPFKKLFSTLKRKWERSSKFSEQKFYLLRDLEIIKYEIVNNNIGDTRTQIGKSNYKSRLIKLDKGKYKLNLGAFITEFNIYTHNRFITKKMLKDLKVYDLLNKLGKTRNDDGFEDVVDKMFESFYSKMDKRLMRHIIKQETKTFIDSVEYDEESSMSKSEYKKKKIELQIELVKLQEWAIANKKKVAIVFEGRDAAGKGSSIKRFIEYINPKFYRVVALGIPTKDESENWFPRYEEHLPNEGEIVFFDRSWYNRAVVEPTMGYCSDDQYQKFMDNVVEWENKMIEDDIILIKFWFSIKQEKQLERFELRKHSPLKHWKFSPNDAKTISKWDVMTKYKDQMFERTSTENSPWVVVKSNDKRVSRLNSIKYVLNKIQYTGKDEQKDLTPSSDVVTEII